jgi:putative spermidine/putrescine transport system substrate-binding protein
VILPMRSTALTRVIVLVSAVIAMVDAVAAEQLVIQTWAGVWEDGARAVGDAFGKRAGVDVRYEQQVNTRQGIAKIRAQKDNPQVDVVFSTADALEQALSDKAIIPINPAMAPNLGALPKQAVRQASLDIGYILFGLAYRTDLVPFEIKQYEDLLDPRLKARVASPTAQYSSGRWIVQLAVNNGGSERNVDPAFAFLQKLKPNIATFVVGTDPIKVLQAGEAAVTYLIFSEIAKLLGPNSTYRFVLPEGKPVITNVLAIGMTNPKKAELAHRFLDYMATPEAQEAYCAKIVCTPPNPKAQPPAELRTYRPPAELIYAPDWDLINKNLPAWDDRFKKEIQTR